MNTKHRSIRMLRCFAQSLSINPARKEERNRLFAWVDFAPRIIFHIITQHIPDHTVDDTLAKLLFDFIPFPDCPTCRYPEHRRDYQTTQSNKEIWGHCEDPHHKISILSFLRTSFSIFTSSRTHPGRGRLILYPLDKRKRWSQL